MKAVIFDMDGVIIDSEPIHFRVENRIFAELGLEISQEEHESFLGTNSPYMFGYLKEQYGLEEEVEYLVELERRRYLEELTSGTLPVIPGIPELVTGLAGAGFRLAVASSAPHEQIDQVMEISGLAPFFPVRVSGDDVRESKPHPDIFLKAAKEMDVSPGDCTVLEDSTHGIAAALAAGMAAIAFAADSAPAQDLSAADVKVNSIPDAAEMLLPGS